MYFFFTTDIFIGFLTEAYKLNIYDIIKIILRGVPVVAQQKQIRLVAMRLWVPSLTSLSGLRIRHCHKLWCSHRHGSDLALLWLCHRPAATAPKDP